MQKLVQIGKILSDSNRVKILALLKREKELCVCEICDTLQLSQPLVSRHLKQMLQADVVTKRQEGKWILYSLHTCVLLECLLQQLNDIELPKLVACSKR